MGGVYQNLSKKSFWFNLNTANYEQSLAWDRLRTLDDPLCPQAPTTNREGGIAEAILFVRFGEVAAAAKSAGCKHKIVQTLPVGHIFRIIPDLTQGMVAHTGDDMLFGKARFSV
jgi:hypothetical protein